MSRPECPERFKHSIQLFVDGGCRPGGFMTAILSNDLFGAVNSGDDEAVAAIPSIVRFIHQTVRSDCYGTPEKVAAWRGAKEISNAA